MLYLGPPMLTVEVEGHTVYVLTDSADPLQFYYLPNYPHVSALPDGRPAIRLVTVRHDLDEIPEGSEEAVGFLALDVDLSFPVDVIDALPGKIRSELMRAGTVIDGEPRVSPIPYLRGTVRFLLLDRVSVPEDGDAATTQPQSTDFVVKTLQATTPSLYGDNRAIFQARLTKAGIAAIQGSLDGLTPIGVVYELVYAGLQPAYTLKITADIDQAYHHFSTRKQADWIFYNEDIRKALDELEQEQVIKVEMDILGVGGEGMESDAQKVRDRLLDWVIETFFNQGFSKTGQAGDRTVDDLKEVHREIVKTAVTGGFALLGSNTYSLKDIKQVERRSAEIDWTVRKAVERRIHPQAHVAGLLKDSGLAIEDISSTIDVGDLFSELEVTLATDADWTGQGISAISVDLRYGGEDGGEARDEWSVLLDKEHPRDRRRGWLDPTIGERIQYRYEVVFNEAVPGPSTRLDSGWRTHQGTVLVIQPRELFDDIRLEFSVLPGFPYDRWPAVQAMVRYRSEDESFLHATDKVLRTDSPTFTHRFRVNRDIPGTLERRLRYIGVDGNIRDTGWLPLEERNIPISDPFAPILKVMVRVAPGTRKVESAVVSLSYQDDDNGIYSEGQLIFDPENIKKPQSWAVHLADPSRRRYRFSATLFYDDGTFFQTDWIETDAAILPVGEVFFGTLPIEVSLLGEFPEMVEKIEVKLRYEDEENAILEEEDFELGPGAQPVPWTVRLKDPSRRTYDYTLTWRTRSGFDTRVGPVTTSSPYLVVPAAPPQA